MATATLTFPTPYPTAIVVTSLTRTDNGNTVSGSIAGASAAWVLTITEPAPGLTYAYIVTATFPNGTTAQAPGTVVGALVDPNGIWCTPAQYQNLHNIDNFRKWFADSTGVISPAQEVAAVHRAGNEIIARFARNYFIVPDSTFALVGILSDVEAEFINCYGYLANGVAQQDKNVGTARFGKLQPAYDLASNQLEELLFKNRGGFTRVTGYFDGPVAVNATVTPSGMPIENCPPWPIPSWTGYRWVWGNTTTTWPRC